MRTQINLWSTNKTRKAKMENKFILRDKIYNTALGFEEYFVSLQ